MNELGAKLSNGVRTIQRAVVRQMIADLPGETDEVLMHAFGISYNTWRKVRAGKPIRRSVADRLEQRVLAGRLNKAFPVGERREHVEGLSS